MPLHSGLVTCYNKTGDATTGVLPPERWTRRLPEQKSWEWSKISVSAESREEAYRLFNGLSADGSIEVPIGDNPEDACFGMFRDKFGIEWIVDFDSKY